MVDLNSLVTSASGAYLAAAFWANGRGEIIAGGFPPGCDSVETCGHTYVLIPCDENHPSFEGCDYSLVDPATAVEVHAPESKHLPATASHAKLSPAGMLARYRSLLADRRGFAIDPSPKHHQSRGQFLGPGGKH